jgi:hypothetical protein
MDIGGTGTAVSVFKVSGLRVFCLSASSGRRQLKEAIPGWPECLISQEMTSEQT